MMRFLDSSLERFIESLEKPVIARVLRTIDLLERFGSGLGLPHAKKISPDLFELRISGKQKVRIFYTFRNSEAVLLHSFVKKSQKIPKKELEVAKKKIKMLDTI